MDELRVQLQSSLQDRYTIERELTGGGLARVFVARELTLDRRVVIKVLSPELAAGLSAKRFAREIKLAASLQQANIVPVLSAGQSGDVAHYTMPFVEGLSLRERLERSGRPPLDQTVGILRDVARALAFAHDAGVVHRDIKPENILLSGDAAVVTDFGIAKAISAAAGEAVRAPYESLVTQPGTAVGTPAYMAPEQMSGDPNVDHRADLYSFGCVAYELLTGEPPFSGTLQALFTAHLSETPPDVTRRCPQCPPALAALVMKCLAKDPAARPPSARAILRALDAELAPATGFDRLRRRFSWRELVGTFGVLTLVTSGIFYARRNPATAGETSSVAVLPFINLSGDTADEYIADGIADELSTALGKIPRIRVVSRGLSYRFKGRREIDVRQAGKELSADLLLHGSVRRIPGGVRVSAWLVDCADSNEVWAQNYTRQLSDALVFQDSITRAIAVALRGELTGDSIAVAALSPVASATPNADAYDLYLRGRYLLQRRGSGVRQAVEKFQEAIARDSGFARAHAALALALQLLPYFEPIHAATMRERTEAAARRALRRDSALSEAHTALAMAYQHAYQWERADTAYRRAVAIDSSEADAHIQYGRFLWYTGRFAEAQAEFERARRMDPYSAVASGWVGYLRFLSGRQAEGLAELRRALEIDSTVPPLLGLGAVAFFLAGQIDVSRELSERLWRVMPPWRPVAAANLAHLGDRERALLLIRQLEQERQPGPLTGITLATLYLGTGDHARALAALERANEAGEIWPTYYSLSEPRFDPLRRSARFAAIVRQIGLDEAVFTSPSGGRPR